MFDIVRTLISSVRLNFVYLFFCGGVFTLSLLKERVLTQGNNFLMLLALTLTFLLAGWAITTNLVRSREGPYRTIYSVSPMATFKIVVTHTWIIISALLYMNIVTAMICLYWTTGEIYYAGMFALPGAFISIKLVKDYIRLKSLELKTRFGVT